MRRLPNPRRLPATPGTAANVNPLRKGWRPWISAALGALGLAYVIPVLAAGGNTNPTTASFSPAAVTLTTAVGNTSTVNVSLFDTLSPPLTISTIGLSGAQAADYQLGGTCAAGVIVNRSVGPCTIVVGFAPGATGTRSATLTATFANAPTINLALNGSGVPPTPSNAAIKIDNLPASGSVDFGSRPVGFVANPPLADIFFLISDVGGSNLLISEQIVGTNSADFTISGIANKGSFCVNTPILNPANLPCQLPLTFAPTTTGVRVATLRITTNDPGRPTIDIPLTGVGTPAVITPPPPVVSFADVSGIWGTPGETGWALAIAHNKLGTATSAPSDAVLAWWESFDTTGQPIWFQLRDGQWPDAQTWTGNVHRYTGSPFTGPYAQGQRVDTIVGTATLNFTSTGTGTLTFTINGFGGTKTMTRNPFVF